MRASSLRWIRENSRPKTYPREPTISRGKVVKLKKLLPRIEIYSQPRHNYGADNFRPYAVSPMALTYRASRRINNLALPVPRKQFFDPRFDPEQNWYIIMMITEKTMNHKASERLKRLARPLRPIKKWEPPEEKRLVKPSALQYKATPIIEKLAQPRMKSKKFKKSKPVYVKKGALTATASARVTALSKARSREDKVNRKDPYAISKAALHGTASERVSELSKTPSRKYTPRFTPESEIHEIYMAEQAVLAEEKRQRYAEKRQRWEQKWQQREKKQKQREKKWQQEVQKQKRLQQKQQEEKLEQQRSKKQKRRN